MATRDGGMPVCIAEYSYPPLPEGSVSLRGGYVYWTTFSVAQQRGLILRAPLDGGAAQIVSSQPEYPYGLITDQTHAYWIPLWLKEIHRIPLAGGPTEVFATNQNLVSSLTLDSTHAYWTADGDIRRAPLDGGAFTVSYTVYFASQLTVKDGVVYWKQTGGTIQRGPGQGGAVQRIATLQDSSSSLTTDGVSVYWFNDNSPPNARLMSPSVDGGPAVVLLTPPGQGGGIALHGNDIYFGGASLRRLPR